MVEWALKVEDKMPKKGHCSNRDIVNVARRLYSPKYSDDGKPRDKWYHIMDNWQMCYYNRCNYDSYNDWVTATDKYINGKDLLQLSGRIKRAESVIRSKLGGAPMPDTYFKRFEKFKNFVDSWNDSGIRPNKTWSDIFVHPSGQYWKGKVSGIVDWFDKASCMYDEVEELELELTGDRSNIIGAPTMVADGNYFGNEKVIPPPDNSILSKSAGALLIVGAGLLAYKMLTE